jgi:hypothetical protein
MLVNNRNRFGALERTKKSAKNNHTKSGYFDRQNALAVHRVKVPIARRQAVGFRNKPEG